MRVETKNTKQTLAFETGMLARQANASILVIQGDSRVLVTVTVSKEERKGIDFLPLVVDYQEMSFAVGRIPGGFIKREGRPSDQEILTARFIDRPIRPLIPKGFFNEIQIIATVLSGDPSNNPDVMAINAASAALHISEVPFKGPLAGVRVGFIDGAFVINPPLDHQDGSDMDIIVVGTEDAIVMVEGEAKELSEDTVVRALDFAHSEIKKICQAQDELRDKVGKEKMPFHAYVPDEAMYEKVKAFAGEKLEQIMLGAYSKQDRHARTDALRAEALEHFAYDAEDTSLEVSACFSQLEKEIVRKLVLDKGRRVDGRNVDEIRPIECAVGLLPRAHGSALFTRGETQALAITTLGTSRDEQRLESLLGETSKSFMVHYSFPPFSVGEVKPLRGPTRREIGHGNLAERALKQVLPGEDVFPYTIRLVSEILESNGSSSMATVCSGSMALMDAGVPIKKPVAGIAMGLLKEGDSFLILTDILGDEDQLGDMDFKVAGTADGITALQMDIKISGVSGNILAEALEKARKARLSVLDRMNATIDKPRDDISPYAPRIYSITIKPDRIRDVIGPGGKIIKEIIAKTETTIEIDDSGKVDIFSPDKEKALLAIRMINDLTEEVQLGQVYVGKVAKVTNYGAFVDILPGASGLVHISQLAKERIQNVRDVVKEGDEILVKVIGIDKDGKIRLSRKEALDQALKGQR